MGVFHRVVKLVIALAMLSMVSLMAVRYYGMYRLPDFATLAALPSSSAATGARVWRTFSGLETATAASWQQPRTVDELVIIVARAREQSTTVKVVGAGTPINAYRFDIVGTRANSHASYHHRSFMVTRSITKQ